jgi:hypothetical protein
MPGNNTRPQRPPVVDNRPKDRPIAKVLPKTLPGTPDTKGNIGEWQKKFPGLFLGQSQRPGQIVRPGNPIGGDGRWQGRPGNFTRPTPEVRRDFNNNFRTAINRTNRNNFFIQSGGRITGIDLSRNVNFRNFRGRAVIINNRMRPFFGTWFRAGWWNRFPVVRWPAWHYRWSNRPPSWWWRPFVWSSAVPWLTRVNLGPPIIFDYGSNVIDQAAVPVIIQNNIVYINQQPVASADVFAQQAIDLADLPAPAADATFEWMPLGTWALSADMDDPEPSIILQLAMSRDGIVSGTWYNRFNDASDAIEGRLDPETQRVALRKIDEPFVVLEVGLFNLSEPATSCLMHFGTLQTQVWHLTRLEMPEE